MTKTNGFVPSPADEESDCLHPDAACPKCGEYHIDNLVWDDDGENVKCASCGTVYDPNKNFC